MGEGAEMSGEAKDPAIKLFGKTIQLPDVTPQVGMCGGVENEEGKREGDLGKHREEGEEGEEGEEIEDDDKELSDAKERSPKQEDESQVVTSKEATSSDTMAGVSSKTDEEQSTSTPQEKVLKKPDKILPCPRCNSMDTKFCYFNNYNVNQPRHFCKNCQRYWTAGGTMRNVPVGAGRRKNKGTGMASNSNCRHISVPEALQIPNGVHHPPQLKTSGTILTFGSADSRLCESMASVLNIADRSLHNCTQNGFHKPEELIIPAACRNGEKGVDSMSDPLAGALQLNHGRENAASNDQVLQNALGFSPQIAGFPGAPWPYPVSPPVFVPPMFPMPFYPSTTYWSIPWIPQPQLLQPTASTSGPNSSTLGKHSRDENMGEPGNSGKEDSSTEGTSEKCFWVPKTLRIDDPREAAKSSIWTTLGFKNEKSNSISGGGLFKAFEPNGERNSWVSETSAVLKANPAAFSRSLNFLENS